MAASKKDKDKLKSLVEDYVARGQIYCQTMDVYVPFGSPKEAFEARDRRHEEASKRYDEAKSVLYFFINHNL